MMEVFLNFVWSAIGGYAVVCLICTVLFWLVVLYEWWSDKREKRKQDESMREKFGGDEE